MKPFVDRLTSTGRGAVAVLRVTETPEREGNIDQHFHSVSNQNAADADIGKILYGHWHKEDVVVVRTAVAVWEIHCHGGEAAVSRIMSDLSGVPSKTEDNLSLNDRLNQLVLRCRTRQTVRYLLAQKHGLQREFLTKLLQTSDNERLRSFCTDYLQHSAFATHLAAPWALVVAGQPNAGKSSLLNAIVGFERSIVFNEPGTTRDRIEAETVIDGWPFRFQDTAGIRAQTDDAIEATGIEAARDSIAHCEALLLVVDSVKGWSDFDQQLINLIPPATPAAVIWNKNDLPGQTPPSGPFHVIPTSAKHETGIAETMAWLTTSLVGVPPPIDTPLPVFPDINSALIRFCDTNDDVAMKQSLEALLCSLPQH